MATTVTPVFRARAVLFVLVLLLPLVAFAQSTNATLDGTIKDGQGGVLPGATVTATNEATGLTRAVTTGERGSYRISELPPGQYTVRVEMPAFSPVERKGVTLTLGGNL